MAFGMLCQNSVVDGRHQQDASHDQS